MTFTYDLNTGGALRIKADLAERQHLKEDKPTEGEALESLLANSDLDWIQPDEIGALTDAPILGFREDGNVIAAWGFMDYQVQSFVDDLIEKGEAVFIS